MPRRPGDSEPSRSLSLQDRVKALKLPDPDERRSSGGGDWTKLLLGLAMLIVLGSVGAIGYLFVSREMQKQDAPANGVATTDGTSATSLKPSLEKETGNSAVNVASSTGNAGTIVLESKGYIIPAHQILVSPKVSGMIVKLHFDKLREGQRVPKGAPLAEIENVEYQAELDRARANFSMAKNRWEELDTGSRPEEIEEAWNQWKESEETLKNLKSTFERNAELRKRNVLSLAEFDLSKAEFDAAVRRTRRFEATWKLVKEGPRAERIRVAAAEMELAKADLQKAEWRFGNCIIRAPISGTLLKKNAEEGNIVNPVAFNGSFSLCEMADLSDLEVDLSVQESDISKVFEHQKCTVRADAFRNRSYEGYVSRLMPIADRAKGAIPVRVKIRVPTDEEGRFLKPEMSASVVFYEGKSDRVPPPASTEETAKPTGFEQSQSERE